MKNALLFIFATLTVAFASTSYVLYTNQQGKPIGSLPDQLAKTPQFAPSAKTYQGQIFVVTRGGESIPLGGLVVSFHSLQVIKDYELRMYQALASDVAKHSEKFEKQYMKYAATEAIYNEVVEKQQYKKYKTIRGMLDDEERYLRYAYENLLYVSGAKPYAEAAPESAITTQTDASGKFSLTLPADEPLVAATCASREVSDKTERYCWFINMDGSKAVLMNNHNVLGKRSDDSAIKTPGLPLDCKQWQECAAAVYAVKQAYAPYAVTAAK